MRCFKYGAVLFLTNYQHKTQETDEIMTVQKRLTIRPAVLQNKDA